MKLSVAELLLIVDTLDRSLLIGNAQFFMFDRETRGKVRDHIVQELNQMGVPVNVEDRHGEGTNPDIRD